MALAEYLAVGQIVVLVAGAQEVGTFLAAEAA
jgi:hypothetical protein